MCETGLSHPTDAKSTDNTINVLMAFPCARLAPLNIAHLKRARNLEPSKRDLLLGVVFDFALGQCFLKFCNLSLGEVGVATYVQHR